MRGGPRWVGPSRSITSLYPYSTDDDCENKQTQQQCHWRVGSTVAVDADRDRNVGG
jgi:hypothetical protein